MLGRDGETGRRMGKPRGCTKPNAGYLSLPPYMGNLKAEGLQPLPSDAPPLHPLPLTATLAMLCCAPAGYHIHWLGTSQQHPPCAPQAGGSHPLPILLPAGSQTQHQDQVAAEAALWQAGQRAPAAGRMGCPPQGHSRGWGRPGSSMGLADCKVLPCCHQSDHRQDEPSEPAQHPRAGPQPLCSSWSSCSMSLCPAGPESQTSNVRHQAWKTAKRKLGKALQERKMLEPELRSKSWPQP